MSARSSLDRLVNETLRFTPADIQYLFEQVAQLAFEREVAQNQRLQGDYRGLSCRSCRKMRPSLTDEIIEEFEKDALDYSRV